MRDIDYEYIASNISDLTRIPIRVYRGSEQIIYCNPTNFPKDPATPYLGSFMEIEHEISYYITPYEQFYGLIHYAGFSFIIGPTYQIVPSREKIREFMFILGIKKNYMELYQNLLNDITPMPLELFLHELCLIYYFISEKKVELSDIMIFDSNSSVSAQNRTTAPRRESKATHSDELKARPDIIEHTTFDFERSLLLFVQNGDTDGLLNHFKTHSSGRPGKVAQTYLRQIKNIFISTATLVSRAAIAGGLPAEEALSLSDRYIQHCENHNDPEQIMNLQYHMVLDYTSLVAELRDGARYDKFLRDVTSYVREHLCQGLSVDQMAKDLYMSRSYLSTKFKKETGMTLSAYIQEQQILRAKEYLKNTDKSILEISTYLGFSSQGYFQNVFKKQTGMTPKEFREQ